MKKKLKLQCWNCPKTYFENLEIADEQEFIVKCPYCGARAVVTLRPYRKQLKNAIIYRGENEDTYSDEDFQIPDVVPTRKPE